MLESGRNTSILDATLSHPPIHQWSIHPPIHPWWWSIHDGGPSMMMIHTLTWWSSIHLWWCIHPNLFIHQSIHDDDPSTHLFIHPWWWLIYPSIHNDNPSIHNDDPPIHPFVKPAIHPHVHDDDPASQPFNENHPSAVSWWWTPIH